MEQARCGVDVVAGVLPGQPMEEFTRRWFMTSRDWQEYGPEQRTNALCDLAGKANAYATFLMLQPDRVNWVKTEWVWF